ncbi:MAG: DUF711 family protein [Anaerolineales bacterium]|jgi:uncharacterized protein (UPF0210 family)
MKIRALTGFLDPGYPVEPKRIETIAACLQTCKEMLQDSGYEVQTLRIAAPPPAEMEQPVPPGERANFARQLEAESFVNAIDYASIGPALPDELDGYAFIPNVLGATEIVFASGLFADPENGVSLPAARACARAIQETSLLTDDGFSNLRFAALANVAPGTPFFPAAYHRGGNMTVAIATEAADLAVESLKEARSLSHARRRLVGAIETHAASIQSIAQRAAVKHETQFLGIDFSMAPYPEEARSIGSALEALGIPTVGLSGTAAGVAFLADCLDRAQFVRTGFCGMFMPVLEDYVLAGSAAKKALSVNALLLYATLCGTGLDTIPLPGDVTAEAMTAVLLDIGAVSLRHNKPLTARLMPIPESQPGDEIHFDFPYFADSRVMNLAARPLEGLLAGPEVLYLGPHLS